MLINLSNGKKYRVSWKHLDASADNLNFLMDNKKYEEAGNIATLFDKVLHTYYHNENDYMRMLTRLHGVTECFMVEIVGGKERIEEANGVAFCSSRDHFNKELGRKRSLLDALDFVIPLDEPLLSPREWKERKQLRGEVWEAYRKSSKEPRWGK